MEETDHIKQNTTESSDKPVISNDEIDLIALFKAIWSKKKFIGKVTFLFIVFGFLIAFTTPEEYKTSATLIPEMMGSESKLGGSLGGLASLAGVDLGGLQGGSQSINPALYQSVSRSTPFLMELMNQSFYFSEVGASVSLYDYYMLHMKTSLFGKILSAPGYIFYWIKGSEDEVSVQGEEEGVLRLTEYQEAIIEDLQSRVFVEMDWDLNIVTVEVEMQDPRVAAEMVQFTKSYITDYVTQYAVSKSKEQYVSVEGQYQDRKVEFEQAQYKLASFRDKNQNVTTARARSEEERLQSEYNLSFNVYNQLAQQREAIKLQIQEKTPVFTVLEPVKVPVEKSKPRKSLIILGFGVLGFLVSCVRLLIKN